MILGHFWFGSPTDASRLVGRRSRAFGRALTDRLIGMRHDPDDVVADYFIGRDLSELGIEANGKVSISAPISTGYWRDRWWRRFSKMGSS